MPELPEVETIVRGLAHRVTGDAIASVWIGEKSEPLKSPPGEIAATLLHSRIAAVRRVGKQIVFDLENGAAASGTGIPSAQWIVHLGMTGRLLVARPEALVEPHTHAIIRLASGRELRFVDPRRFGRLSVARRDAAPSAGSEPLDVDFDSFVSLFRGRRTPIKSALLNQKLLRGVGNIYADESLFRAGIRPRRRAASLTRVEFSRLRKALRKVLNQAIAAGGSSVSNYVDADGEQGWFQFEHRVYQRHGEPCLKCGASIKRVLVAGRGTHYGPRCQR
ncbi:MAG: bifunctional DNA-formamidopyrimidine glycosylase/DNA-(apurinic or apyrimidinic site) lyase, partial [Terriglobales bacterium]